MKEQIAAGTPVYAPSAIAARGGKFCQLPGEPGYVRVSTAGQVQPRRYSWLFKPTAIEDPKVLVAQWKAAAVNAKEAGFDGVECECYSTLCAEGFAYHLSSTQ